MHRRMKGMFGDLRFSLRRRRVSGALRKFSVPLAVFALMAALSVGVPALTVAQESGGGDGESPNRVVVDADKAAKGDVLLTGEQVREAVISETKFRKLR